jgi:hypothetical protein
MLCFLSRNGAERQIAYRYAVVTVMLTNERGRIVPRDRAHTYRLNLTGHVGGLVL